MSVITYETNARRAGHFLGLVLAKLAGDGNPDNGIAILAGSGAPSGATYGGQTLAAGQNALAIDAASADVDALIYGTINGGINWYPLDFTPGAVASLALARGFVIRGSAAGVGEALDGGGAQGIIYSDGTDMQRGQIQAHAQITTSSVSTGLTAAGASTASAGVDAMVTQTITNPLTASTTAVHARNEDNIQNWPGPFTNPDVPRCLTISFEAAWAGGDVTVVGTDWDDAAQTEVIADTLGATVPGMKPFKTVTSATNELVGAGGVNHGASIGYADRLGLAQAPTLPLGICAVKGPGLTEAASWGARWVDPTTACNGAISFDLAYPVAKNHAHTAGAITVTEVAHAHTGTPDAHTIS